MEIIFLMISALFIFYISFCIYATFHEKNSSMFGMLGFLSFFGFVLPILLFISGILNLCYGCGLRRTEVEKLLVEDIHLTEKRLYVRSGKGKKRRVIHCLVWLLVYW